MSSGGSRVEVRELFERDLGRLREIDRSERVRLTYRVVAGALEAVPADLDVPTFSAHAQGPDSLAVQVELCKRHLAAGALALGAFEDERLVGVGLLTPAIRPGLAQLAYLHVSRSHRRQGIASRLVRTLVERALQSGARKVYVSATPSESAVELHRSQGFRLSTPLPELLELEPEDIHMVADLDHQR